MSAITVSGLVKSARLDVNAGVPRLLIQYLSSYDRAWGDIGYAKPGDAGFDLRAAIAEPVELFPGSWRLIGSGIKVAIPYGYEIQVRGRSGLASKYGLSVLHGVGTIDAGYRGELGVLLKNGGHDPYLVRPGERIAQAVVAAVGYLPMAEVEELPDSERGETGFGSSGAF